MYLILKKEKKNPGQAAEKPIQNNIKFLIDRFAITTAINPNRNMFLGAYKIRNSVMQRIS